MLIAITGYCGSGKDTVADYLTNKHGFVKKTFADPLKKACHILFDFTTEQLYGTQEDKCKMDDRWKVTPRAMMQWLGTDILRQQFDPHFFVNHFEFTYNNNADTVVSDLRFVNESLLIKKLGGVIIRINRHTNEDIHLSETELDCIIPDIIINNHGSLNDLYQHIDDTINHIMSMNH